MSHIGELGERREFEGTLVRIVTRAALFNGMPFRTLRFHVPLDACGYGMAFAVLMWRTSAACTLVEGQWYRFTATVKAHRVGVPVCGQADNWTDILRVVVHDEAKT